MKLKYFLRGLGTGIIFATLVLMISYHASDKTEMTDGQIIKRAKELGMVMETDELKDKLQDLQSPTPTPQQKEKVKNDETKLTEKTAEEKEEKKEQKEEDKTKNEVKEYTKFSIKQGMSSAQISRYLENIGLVDKAEKFDKYLCDNGYSNRISVGSFEVSSSPDYEEIAKAITKSN